MNREAFEKAFPVPATMIRWDEVSQAYVSIRGGLSMTADTYNDRLRVWQAAKADSAAQVEAIKEQCAVLCETEYAINDGITCAEAIREMRIEI